MRAWRAISLIFAGFLLGLPVWAQQREIVNGHPAVANEVLIKMRAGVRFEIDGYIVRAHDIRASRALNSRGMIQLHSGSEPAARLVAELSAEPDVEFAEPNYIVHSTATPAAVVPNDPLFIDQWALQNTGLNGGLAQRGHRGDVGLEHHDRHGGPWWWAWWTRGWTTRIRI